MWPHVAVLFFFMRKQIELFQDFGRREKLGLWAHLVPVCSECPARATINLRGVLYCDAHGPTMREMGEWDSCGRVR